MRLQFRDKRLDRYKVVVRNAITLEEIADGRQPQPVGWAYSIYFCVYYHPAYLMTRDREHQRAGLRLVA